MTTRVGEKPYLEVFNVKVYRVFRDKDGKIEKAKEVGKHKEYEFHLPEFIFGT